MSSYLALAVSVGLLAILDTWFYVGPLALLLPGMIWVSFVAWGCFFHSGAGTKGLTTAIIGMSFGAVVGMAAVMGAGALPLGEFALPVTVGIGAFVICLASAVGLLSTIPASVYGFASIAGPIALTGRDPMEALWQTVLSIIIGAVFGIVSEKLAAVLTKKGA